MRILKDLELSRDLYGWKEDNFLFRNYYSIFTH